MIKLIHDLFSEKNDVRQNISGYEKFEIPIYPSVSHGFPVISTDEIIDGQLPLINEIEQIMLSESDTLIEFAKLVIENYATYVHLLPASEIHHHHTAGGLFEHGLEVGLWSIKNAFEYCSNNTFCDDRPRWLFSAFLAGLLHDIGKPLSDYTVINEDGTIRWDPYSTSLLAWAKKEGISQYHLSWHENRKNRHKRFAVFSINQIITPKLNTYINKPGPMYKSALSEAIFGISPKDPLSQLVIWSDKESVRRNLLQPNNGAITSYVARPIEKIVFDALKKLAKLTKTNTSGAVIWRSEKSVFIVWNKAIQEIHNLVDFDQISSIPKDHNILADILIERGLAIPPNNIESEHSRYWTIYPEKLKGQHLVCLRVDQIELIFPNEPISPINIFLNIPPVEQARKKQTNSPSKFNHEHFQKELVAQIIAGFGHYIDGDVQVLSDNGQPTYRLKKKPTIKRICEYHNWSSSSIAMLFLSNIDGLEIDDEFILIKNI